MRTTINLDDELVAAAQEYTGIQEKSALERLHPEWNRDFRNGCDK